MAFHSSTRNRCRSASVVVLVTLTRTARPSWIHKYSIGLRSGLMAGHSILSTPTFWRKQALALWSWRVELGPRLQGYGFATGCRISSRYLTALRWPSLMTYFASDGDISPHHDTAPHQKLLLNWCINQHCVLHVVSILWPCQPNSCRTWTLNMNIPPHVQVPLLVLPTPAPMGLTVKGSHCRLPGSLMSWEIGCVQSVPERLIRDLYAITSCKPGLQISRGQPTGDRYSWGARFTELQFGDATRADFK